MHIAKAVEMLKVHEGLRLKPYRCTTGRLTIGYGRNIEDCGIVKEEAEFLLIADIVRSEKELCGIFHKFNKFTNNRKAALIDMLFNLGKPRFKNFHNMIKSIKAGDWNSAAGEALDSLWAKQVGNRANEIAGMLRKG